MTIWFRAYTLEELAGWQTNSMADNLEIVFTEIGDDYLKAEMPITHKSVQPFRMLHGGASAALAESIGSVASLLVLDISQKRAVGLALNINHIRGVPEGQAITATAKPFHLGRTTHVWDIQIHDPRGKLCSVARLTMAVIDGSGEL